MNNVLLFYMYFNMMVLSFPSLTRIAAPLLSESYPLLEKTVIRVPFALISAPHYKINKIIK